MLGPWSWTSYPPELWEVNVYCLNLSFCVCLVTVMSNFVWPHGLEPTRLLCPRGFSWQEYWSGLPCPPPEDLPNPEFKPKSPTLQADSWPSEPPGKPKNTGVGSVSLLQGIFLTPESNQGLQLCRWISYQLSYQGSFQGSSHSVLFCYSSPNWLIHFAFSDF